MLPTYRAIEPVTVINGPTAATSIPSGARLVLLSIDGVNAVGLAGSTVRGDFIALQDMAPGAAGTAIRLQYGEILGLVLTPGAAVATGDLLYGGANGTVTNISAGAVFLGKARNAATAGARVGILIETNA